MMNRNHSRNSLVVLSILALYGPFANANGRTVTAQHTLLQTPTLSVTPTSSVSVENPFYGFEGADSEYLAAANHVTNCTCPICSQLALNISRAQNIK